MGIVPSAKSLYLCTDLLGHEDGKIDLFGLFNAIRPVFGYPCVREKLCVFTQLINGLRDVAVQIQIRFAETDEVIHATGPHVLTFSSRTILRQMAVRIFGARFPARGLYFVDLICDNTWVCDATLELR